MNNFTNGDVHDEEISVSNYAYVDTEAENNQLKSRSKKADKKSSAVENHQTMQLSKAASIRAAQKVLAEEAMNMPTTVIFCATSPTSSVRKEDDITPRFVKRFNTHRGNQEYLSKAYRMLNKTRALAGLEPNSKVIDIPSARTNFLLLTQLNNQDIKLAALDSLIAVLQKDQVTKETAFDLIDLAIQLMTQMDRELIQTQLIDEQIKICKAYGMVAELIQWHYGKQHFNGITDDLKRQLINTLKTLEALNTQDNIELHFTVEYALEGFKRLKDDKKELFELGQRMFNFLVGLISIYNDALNVHELTKAFEDIDIHITHSWYNLSLLFNDIAKAAYTEFNKLMALQLMLQYHNKEVNWKFVYNAMQKFADIAVKGSNPKIRKAAFQGFSMESKKLLGLLDFVDCDHFKPSLKKKPLVHFKAPTKKDVNIYIRLLGAQQLIRISQEAPDLKIRSEAKQKLIERASSETDPSIKAVIDAALPSTAKAKKKWLAEVEEYAYKPYNSNLNISEDTHAGAVEKSVQDFFSSRSLSSKSPSSTDISKNKALKRRASQNTLNISTSSSNNPISNSPYLRSNSQAVRSKRLSAPPKSTAKIDAATEEGPKNTLLSNHGSTVGSMQSYILSKCLHVDQQIIEKSIEFNQDIHLADHNELYISKACVQKVIQMIEELKNVTVLDFRKCRFQPEGVPVLMDKLSDLPSITKVILPKNIPAEAYASIAAYTQKVIDLAVVFSDPDDDLQFANYLIKADRILEGIDYLEDAVKKIKKKDVPNPVKLNIYMALGSALELDQQHDEAIEVYKQAYKIEPKNHKLVSHLASLYAGKGDYVQAAKYYREAQENQPDDYVDIGLEELKKILNRQVNANKPSHS